MSGRQSKELTLLLLLSDTRDRVGSARSPHCLISAASNEAEPKECGLRKEGSNFSSSHSSQNPCGSPCNGVGLLERGVCCLRWYSDEEVNC